MNVIDDTNSPRVLRDIDIRNAELRAAWWMKFQRRAPYADQRIGGGVIDATYASKRRLARHKRNAMDEQKIRQAYFPENVCILHKRQAD